MYVYVQLYTVHTVCVQIFVGLYFREFRESTGNREKKRKNTYAYSTSFLLHAAIREIKIAKIVRCGRLRNIHSVKICTHTVRICNNNAYI